jgi:hypothetical protein
VAAARFLARLADNLRKAPAAIFLWRYEVGDEGKRSVKRQAV